MGYDRDEVLSRTNLAELADELLGPHKGRGRSASWPCPAPGHGAQTGRTPPVSVYVGTNGDERWKCHACGTGGTAADLVMAAEGRTFTEAIDLLARRGGVGASEAFARTMRPPRATRPSPPVAPGSCVEVEQYVAACESFLWTDGGRPMRRWLERRGLGEEILRANRVGADPGPAVIERAEGLPRRGVGVVFPVLGEDGTAVYLQTRYLRSDGHRYDNPSTAVAGRSPRISEMRLSGPRQRDDVVLICEGIPDALTAAQAGYRAVAVLGAGYPDERVASGLLDRFPRDHLLLAFDADDRGRAGAAHLATLLHDLGARGWVNTIEVPAVSSDLNGWLQLSPDRFSEELTDVVVAAAPLTHHQQALGASLAPLAHATAPAMGLPELGDTSSFAPPPGGHPLESVYYRFVLLDETDVVAANIDRIEKTVADPSILRQVTGAEFADDLEASLEDIRYRHLLVDNRTTAEGVLRELRQEVSRWRQEFDAVTATPSAVPMLRLAESIRADEVRPTVELPPLGLAL